MNNELDLQKISNEICEMATNIFTQREINNDKKWILNDSENKSLTLMDTEYVYGSIGITEQKLCEQMEKIKNIPVIKFLSSFNNYSTNESFVIRDLLFYSYNSSEYKFDSNIFFEKLKNLTHIVLNNNSYEVTLTGRLHGIKLEADIEIEPNVIILKYLDINAINKRQPLLISEINTGISIIDFSDSNVEIVIKDTCSFSSSIKETINTQKQTKEKMDEKLKNIVMAIKFYSRNRIQVYPANFDSLVKSGSVAYRSCEPMFISENKLLRDNDVEALKKSFSIVNNIISDDPVLKSSFSRFIIGVDEKIAEEKLVDFVIAFESILQTVQGTSNKSELSYRFSLNGASISCVASNNRKFEEMQKFMKAVYDIRSTIVHGGNSHDIDKKLKNTKKKSLVELNYELAQIYYEMIHWLSIIIDKNERPYNKEFGWELLIPKALKTKKSKICTIMHKLISGR